MTRGSMWTGIAAALFALAVILLLVALYRGGSAGIFGAAGLSFAATIACWVIAARKTASEPR